MLNDSEVHKGKYMNQVEIVFKNRYFHKTFFDSNS